MCPGKARRSAPCPRGCRPGPCPLARRRAAAYRAAALTCTALARVTLLLGWTVFQAAPARGPRRSPVPPASGAWRRDPRPAGPPLARLTDGARFGGAFVPPGFVALRAASASPLPRPAPAASFLASAWLCWPGRGVRRSHRSRSSIARPAGRAHRLPPDCPRWLAKAMLPTHRREKAHSCPRRGCRPRGAGGVPGFLRAAPRPPGRPEKPYIKGLL